MILISKYLVPKGYWHLFQISPETLLLFLFGNVRSQDAIPEYKQLMVEKVLINHEKIHLNQQMELLVIPFYLFYSIEFLWRLVQYKNWHLAYRNISFEREAYANEKDLVYLNKRSFWAFLGYLRTNGFQN